MKLFLASISTARLRAKSAADTLTEDYVARSSRYISCATQFHDSEIALLTWLERLVARTVPILILLDSRGKQLSSEAFAAHLSRLRDSSLQHLVFAIGPADGWSETARTRANLLLSLGPMTLPHQLARVVLAEQVYRALTILAGHPYHSGH